MLTHRRGRAPVQNGSAMVEGLRQCLQIADGVDTVRRQAELICACAVRLGSRLF